MNSIKWLWIRKQDNSEHIKCLVVSENEIAKVKAEYESKGYIVL